MVLAPGESREIDLDEGGKRWIARSSFLFGEAEPPTLREKAEALNIKVDGRWGDERIQREIDAVRDAISKRPDNQTPGI